MTSETVYKSQALTEQAVLGIYDIIGEDKSYRNRLAGSYVGYSTDIEKSTKLGDYSTTWTDANVGNSYKGADCWGWLFKGVERANLCINGMEAYSDTTKPKFAYLLAEALTMRAFLYNDIVKLWGDVPYRFDPMTDANKYSPKVDRTLIYERLLSDLARAEKLFNGHWGTQTTVERVNLAFVKGLRARIALMYAGYALRPAQVVQGGSGSYGVQLNVKDEAKRKALYQIAMNECADVMANSGKHLETSYENIFKKQCNGEVSYTNSESLFELPFSDARGQIVNLCGLKTDVACGGHLLNFPNGHSAGGNVTILPGYYYSFNPADTRRDVTASVYKWTYSRADSSDVDAVKALYGTKSILWQKVQSIDKLSLAKWRFEWMKAAPTASTSDDGVNFCVMRYADILLMYAEASIGGITGNVPDGADKSSGLAALNLVHTRAGLTSLADYDMTTIENERAFEFAGEGIRKYDLMRWGLLKTNMDKAVQDVIKYLATTNTNTFPLSKIYIQYTADATLTSDGSIAYKISSVYGNKPGETSKPSGTWKSKSFVGNLDSSGKQIVKTFVYYNYNRTNNDASATSADPDSRQLWPIFQSNINSSNGTLWNDYGYPN
jgi:hypothetical protein